MIKLTRLNETQLIINAEMVEFVESTPDTIISLLSGKKVVVTEPVDQVIDQIVEYRRSCNRPQFSIAS